MDKITLGIPIYNAAGLVERTLLSVLNQTYPDIEYIFVDDKGDSMDIVRRVVGNHPRRHAVRIIDQKENQGIAVARNAIVDNATGRYLFTMDCDDVITLDCIETLYNKMMEHPVDFVAASFVRRDMEGKEYPGCRYQDTLIEGGDHAVARYRYGDGKSLFVATWNKLYDLDFLRKNHIHCQPGHYNEDPWFTYQVIICANSCRLLPDVTLSYTFNPQSVSGLSASLGYSEHIALQYVEIEELKSAYIKSLVSSSFYRALLVDIMFMSIYHAHRIYASSRIGRQQKKAYMSRLLTRSFRLPMAGHGGRNTLKYVLLSCFFALPLACKMGILYVCGCLNLKRLISRWIHF